MEVICSNLVVMKILLQITSITTQNEHQFTPSEGVNWCSRPHYSVLLPYTSRFRVFTTFQLLPIINLPPVTRPCLQILPLRSINTHTPNYVLITSVLRQRERERETCTVNRRSRLQSCGKVSAIKVSELPAAALVFALSASHIICPPVLIE